MLSIIVAMLAMQANGLTCFETGDVRTCSAPDGSTYLERRLGDQVVRQGNGADGSKWTEYEQRVFDGIRTEGLDDKGRHWASQCNPRSGTTGTGRDGQPIFLPPRSRRAETSGDTRRQVDACP